MSTKSEEKIQVHRNRVGRGLHKPMLIDGVEVKKLKKIVVKDIEHQQEKREKNDGITEDGGVHSHISKTRSKRVIEEKEGNCSKLYKTVVKLCLKGGLGYCAKVPMTIWKSDFELWVATYVQKWKTADICKRKPEGRLHAEKKQQYCGAPPPPG